MTEHDWARDSLTAHGVPEEILGDVSAAAASSLRSAARLAAAVSSSDPLPLILDTAVLDTTGGTP